MEKITKEMTISKILENYPGSEQIMFDNGLHCTNCAGANIENFEDGLKSHGMTDENVTLVLDQINEKRDQYLQNVKLYSISVTDAAISEVKDIMSDENRSNEYLKIDLIDNDFGSQNYSVDFSEGKDDHETLIIIDDVNFLIDSKNEKELHGLELDYIRNDFVDGFRITKPKESKPLNNWDGEQSGGCGSGCACGSGGGGCGSGCGCK